MISASVVGLLLMSGCAEEEQIHTYTAKRIDSTTLSMMRGRSQEADEGPREPARMLGAILKQQDKTWFFKLSAPPDEAADLREEFGKFVASTRFENGQPSWEIPDGWTLQTESAESIRFATYAVSPGGPELSVTPLSNQDVLENVNRWRRQLGLTELSADDYQRALDSDKDAEEVFPEDEGEIASITTPAGQAVLVDFVGEMATGGGPPFANMARRAPVGPAPPPEVGPASAPQANSGTPKLNPPDSWNKGQPDGVSIAAYEVGEGDDASRITLSSVGGGLLLNVNRWRRQVGLPPWTAADLAKEKQTLTGEGYTADYFELIGLSETILAAVITHNGRPWIVKLRGPNNSAAKQIDNFKQFVQTIEF